MILNEIARLHHVDGRSKFNTIRVVGQEEIPETIDILFKVTGKLTYGARTREVKLISKKSNEDYPYSAKEYYGKWRKLKNAGLPVTPTMRRVSRKEVAMTDLTANGSCIYDKYKIRRIDKGEPLNRIFLGINTKDILAKAKEVFDKATQHKIALAEDDPLSLVVHPDGKWNIIVLDIDFVKIDYPHAKQSNEVCLEVFEEDIKKLKNKIKNYSAQI